MKKLSRIGKVFAVIIAALTVIGGLSNLMPSMRSMNLIVLALTVFFADLLMSLLMLILLIRSVAIYRNREDDNRGIAKIWYDKKAKVLVVANIAMFALVMPSMVEIVQARVKQYSVKFINELYSVRNYRQQIGLYKSGDKSLEGSILEEIGGSRLEPYFKFMVESRLERISYDRERARKLYEQSQKLRSQYGQFIHYYWKLAEAANLDFRNYVIASELIDAHGKMGTLLDTVVAAFTEPRTQERFRKLRSIFVNEDCRVIIGKYELSGAAMSDANIAIRFDYLMKLIAKDLRGYFDEKTRYGAVARLLVEYSQ